MGYSYTIHQFIHLLGVLSVYISIIQFIQFWGVLGDMYSMSCYTVILIKSHKHRPNCTKCGMLNPVFRSPFVQGRWPPSMSCGWGPSVRGCPIPLRSPAQGFFAVQDISTFLDLDSKDWSRRVRHFMNNYLPSQRCCRVSSFRNPSKSLAALAQSQIKKPEHAEHNSTMHLADEPLLWLKKWLWIATLGCGLPCPDWDFDCGEWQVSERKPQSQQ